MMKNCPLTKWAEKNKQYAPLFLRVVVGLVFITAGYGKLTGIPGVTGFFAGLGIPLPGISAWLVAIVEFFGGIALLLGFGTRHASLLLSIIMVVAIWTTKLKAGAPLEIFSGARLDLMVLAGVLSLLLSGPGPLNLEDKVCKKKKH